MALIRSLTNVSRDRSSRHRKVDAGWRVVHARSETLLQLDTYGSDDRHYLDTISQSIQLDRTHARLLIEAFRKTSPSLVEDED